jgi:hypothetical protein
MESRAKAPFQLLLINWFAKVTDDSLLQSKGASAQAYANTVKTSGAQIESYSSSYASKARHINSLCAHPQSHRASILSCLDAQGTKTRLKCRRLNPKKLCRTIRTVYSSACAFQDDSLAVLGIGACQLVPRLLSGELQFDPRAGDQGVAATPLTNSRDMATAQPF